MSARPTPWSHRPSEIFPPFVDIYDASGRRVCGVTTRETAEQVVISVNRYADCYPNFMKEKA